MAKEKGEKKTVSLTVLKVATTPRTFGDNGKAFLITTEEEIIEGDSYPFKLEVYQEDAIQPIKALIGQGPKDMEIEYVSSYPKEGDQTVHNYKLLKCPGWERSQRGGGGSRQMSPDALGRMLAGQALDAASRQFNFTEDATVDDVFKGTTDLAERYTSWVVTHGKVLAKEVFGGGATPAGTPGNGQGARQQYQELINKLTVMFKENDPEATNASVRAEVVRPFCLEKSLHYPPADDELPQINEYMAKLAG